ncbi:hypothetical protein M0R45_030983 [Rubus argutus]|uniref:Uncharacterized protein n=1 Tax=Rubus argutus TaxID=59490 RepID=A0AAW1WF37_RUBAR
MKRRRNLVRKKASFACSSSNSNGLIVLSFSEIEDITENFKHQIGPEMFKAVLPNKEPVAIKEINASLEERKYRCAVSDWKCTIHGNLKCEIVLLDENLEAKVTEFGLGTIVGDESCSSAMRDVEDFGKMVLVLVSGCREVGDLSEWAYKEWLDGHLENIVDRRLSGLYISQELERVLRIAFWCLQIDERQRPSMSEVVMVLEGTSSVDPPTPFCLTLNGS